jgi:hypothetical protein
MNKNSEPTDSTNIKSFKKRKNDNENSEDSEDENGANVYKPYCSKQINLQPGHTGYLTFATLLNKNFIENKRAEEEEKMNL